MSGQILAALMFPALFVFVFLGLPIAFSLLATAFLFGLPIYGGVIGLQMYAGITQTASQFLLSAVPPFVFMGFMLERSGIAERLFQALRMWLGRLPGGLALATMTMAAVIAGVNRDCRRGRGGDRRDGHSGHAAIRLLPCAGVGHDLRRRVTRHHDPAVHRRGDLRLGRQSVGRPTLRRRPGARHDHGDAVLRIHPGPVHHEASGRGRGRPSKTLSRSASDCGSRSPPSCPRSP